MPNQSDRTGRERRGAASRAEAIRDAVDQVFQSGAAQAEQSRERAADLIDQLAEAAGRVREVFDELRPPTLDELRRLRERIAALEERVAALEAADASPPRRAARRAAPAARSEREQPAKRRTTTRKASARDVPSRSGEASTK